MELLRLSSSESNRYQRIEGHNDCVVTEVTVGNSRKSILPYAVDISGDESSRPVASRKKRIFYIVSGVLIAILLAIVITTSSSTFGRARFNGDNDIEEGSIFPTKSNSNAPTPFKSTTHPDPPTGYWGSVSKPYPTGAFWTNLAVKKGDGAIAVYPYGVKTLETGIQVSYGATRRIVKPLSIADIFDIDLEISATEAYLSRAIEAQDSLSVNMGYKTSGDGHYNAILVKAFPFITVSYENATPIIRSTTMGILNVEARVMKGETGMQYIVTLGNFQRWLVYFSEPVALIWEENTLASPVAIKKGVVRVAILPVQSFEQGYKALAPYIATYPTGGDVSISYPDLLLGGIFGGEPTTAEVKIKYKYTTIANHHGSSSSSSSSSSNNNNAAGSKLLMLALPHHLPLLDPCIINSTASQEAQQYYNPIWSIKGKLTAVVGDTWVLHYTLPSKLGWVYDIAEELPTARMEEIAKSLLEEVTEILPGAEDPYSFGKEIARMAMLALIADYFGIAEVRGAAIGAVKVALIPWLQGSNSDPLLYDSTYGGVVSSNGLKDFMADFGQGWYNDHHFHYGYFLHAAAAIAQIDISTNSKQPFFSSSSSDAATRTAAVEAILKDICNIDNQDVDFPLTRHKDYFDGHSWASGLFSQANGKGQESSSEAANAYYGAYLYGMVNGNAELQRYALTLLAMEIHSVQYYWHMDPNSKKTLRPAAQSIYDSVFAANRMVGNIGGLDVTASTWFGSEAEYVHGIQLMPITPVTGLLFDRDYVKHEYPVLESRIVATEGPESKRVILTEPLCAANPECAELGLEGNCCPNDAGAILSCCANRADSGSGKKLIADEWKSLVYIDLAVVDRENAWGKLMPMKNFGSGNSRSNSLFWTASRPAPVLNFNVSRTASPGKVHPACAMNSACDAQGMLGDCCPAHTENGDVSLLCCPSV